MKTTTEQDLLDREEWSFSQSEHERKGWIGIPYEFDGEIMHAQVAGPLSPVLFEWLKKAILYYQNRNKPVKASHSSLENVHAEAKPCPHCGIVRTGMKGTHVYLDGPGKCQALTLHVAALTVEAGLPLWKRVSHCGNLERPKAAMPNKRQRKKMNHNWLSERQTKRVLTLEDWYPTDQGAVRVSFMRLSDGCHRVCAWGGDDFGLERDYPACEKQQALELFNTLQDHTTQARMRALGMTNA